jgi:hypothetical protein
MIAGILGCPNGRITVWWASSIPDPVRFEYGGGMVFANKPCRPAKLAQDLLRGADEIADFVFGDARQRRKVYHLAETSRIPVFRLGSKLCARPSVLMAWIASQEGRGWPHNPKETDQNADKSAKAAKVTRAITDGLK